MWRRGWAAVIVLSWKQVASLGGQEVAARLRAGQLTRRQVWGGIRGAAKYLPAMAAGRIRDEAEADACGRCCSTCPSHTERPILLDGVAVVAIYCGTIGVEERGEKPTCGCLTAITIDGVVQGAGKACVEGMGCGQGKWLPAAIPASGGEGSRTTGPLPPPG